jgi:hypothetical protein
VAEVDVELIETDDEWSPYLSLEEAGKLDGFAKRSVAATPKRLATDASAR